MRMFIEYCTQKEGYKQDMEKWKRIPGRFFRKRMNMINIQPKDIRYVQLEAEEEDFELRYAFNTQIVIQHYYGNRNKVMVYIPKNWIGRLDIYTESGDICCYDRCSFVLHIPFKRTQHYFCSQFVAELLSLTEDITLTKHPSLYLPNQFVKELEGQPSLCRVIQDMI